MYVKIMPHLIIQHLKLVSLEARVFVVVPE